MKKIVTASQNPDVIKAVQDACKQYNTFATSVYGDTDATISFINFEIPEIKVLDYTCS